MLIIFMVIVLIPPAIFMALFGVPLGIGIYAVSVGILVITITYPEVKTGGLMAAAGPFCLVVIIFGVIAAFIPREIAVGIWTLLLVILLGLTLFPKKEDSSSSL